MTLKFRIKPMTPKQVPELISVERDYGEEPTWPLEWMEFFCGRPFYFKNVALHNRSVIGYIFIQPVPYGLEIPRLVVRRKYRLQGVGKALLQSALDIGRSLDSEFVRVLVREDNLLGANFLKKQRLPATLRWNPVQSTGHYDTLVFTKDLTQTSLVKMSA